MRRIVLWLLVFVLAYGFIRAVWPVLLLTAVAWLVTRQVRSRRSARHAVAAGLAWRADYEHAALMSGDLVIGVHGRFPPAAVV